MTRREISDWFDLNINEYDYVIIDAPWNYVKCDHSSFWDTLSYLDIFQSCKTDFMFIWTTVEGLATLMAQQVESDYELKALMPWLCTTTNVDTSTSSKICKEYLAVFCRPYASYVKTCTTTMIIEPSENYKPRKWEEGFVQMLADKGLAGKYLSPRGFITFRTEKQPQVYKKDLF